MKNNSKLVVTILLIAIVVAVNIWWAKFIISSDLPDWLKYLILK